MAEQHSSSLGTTVKYNPHLWSQDELRAIFVARIRELAEILARIRDLPEGNVPQHLLVTGAHGMGKSTLLNRVALAIFDDVELSKQWLPLVMPEEQYTISTIAELWMNILGVLADTWEQLGIHSDELAYLDQEMIGIKSLEQAKQEEAALALLTNVVRRGGCRLLLLMDSTDQLFGNLSQDQVKNDSHANSSTQLWRLRKTLSHCPELYWLGASYQALELSQQYNDAFHDFFELIELRPHTLEEMREAMLALARTFGVSGYPAGVQAAQAMLRNLDDCPERLKTLRAITGGNPRTTVILYDLFATGWKDDLQSDLKALLDSMTPLYKARLENLAEQPRKILAHIMEHWAPISLADLSKISSISGTTLSGQLKRLELEGYIEKTRMPGTRRNGYQVSERLFNIWYLMRNTSRWVRQKLGWLIEFMRIWYSLDILISPIQAQVKSTSLGKLDDDTISRRSGVSELSLEEECIESHQLDQENPCNLARSAYQSAQSGQEQKANEIYRHTVKLISRKAESTGSFSHPELLLQAHIWLHNKDAASLALENLAQAASIGEKDALALLRRQAGEVSALGLGLELSELMANCRFAGFLQPMTVALRAAAGIPDALEGVAAEIKMMAAEVLSNIKAYQNTLE